MENENSMKKVLDDLYGTEGSAGDTGATGPLGPADADSVKVTGFDDSVTVNIVDGVPVAEKAEEEQPAADDVDVTDAFTMLKEAFGELDLDKPITEIVVGDRTYPIVKRKALQAQELQKTINNMLGKYSIMVMEWQNYVAQYRKNVYIEVNKDSRFLPNAGVKTIINDDGETIHERVTYDEQLKAVYNIGDDYWEKNDRIIIPIDPEGNEVKIWWFNRIIHYLADDLIRAEAIVTLTPDQFRGAWAADRVEDLIRDQVGEILSELDEDQEIENYKNIVRVLAGYFLIKIDSLQLLAAQAQSVFNKMSGN